MCVHVVYNDYKEDQFMCACGVLVRVSGLDKDCWISVGSTVNGLDKDCWISVGLLSNQSQADSSGLDNDCGFLNAAQSTALKKIMEFCVQPSPVTKTVDFCVHCDFDKHCGFLCAL